MKIYEVVGEGESQTCAKALVLSVGTILEGAVEVLQLVLGDTEPCVTDYDADAVKFVVGCCNDAHFTVFPAIFGCIGYQIVDNLVEFVCINPAHHAFRMTFDDVFHLLFYNQGLQILGSLADVAHHIALGTKQFQCSGLRFAGLQNLLEHSHHTLDIDLHEVIVVR